MANQYDVLGKAPGLEDLNKLSPNDVHLTIRGLSAGYGKMEILHNFDLTVSKAQSLCLIGPERSREIYNTSFYLWLYKYF
jgi:branched-chain amino acid transport system ATP-binding protein